MSTEKENTPVSQKRNRKPQLAIAALIIAISLTAVYATSTMSRSVGISLTVVGSANVTLQESDGTTTLTAITWGELLRGSMYYHAFRLKNLGDAPVSLTWSAQNVPAGITITVQMYNMGQSGWVDLNGLQIQPGQELGVGPNWNRITVTCDPTMALGLYNYQVSIIATG